LRYQFENRKFISTGFMANSGVEIEPYLILIQLISQLGLTLIDSQLNQKFSDIWF